MARKPWGTSSSAGDDDDALMPSRPAIGNSSSGRDQSPSLMDIVKYNWLSLLVAGTIAGSGIFYSTCTKFVHPDDWGVRQVNYSPFGILGNTGTHETVLETGSCRQLPTCETIQMLPKDTCVYTMRTPLGADRTEADEKVSAVDEHQTTFGPAAHIQTSDGFYVNLDLSILYRITDPVKVLTKVGPGDLYETNVIIPNAEPTLKMVLGGMMPEDFFDPKIRHDKLVEATKKLNDVVEPYGLHIDHILARYPHLHPDVAAKIEGTNRAHQQKLLNIALTAQSEQEALLKKMVTEGTAAKSVILQQGIAYETTRGADKDLYETQKHADGDKAVALADAHRSEVLNKAYQGEGSELLVGMKMAENLKNLDQVLVPFDGPNAVAPLNLDKMVQTLTGKTQPGPVQPASTQPTAAQPAAPQPAATQYKGGAP